MYFLNVYRSDLVLRDRLCVGDAVQVKYGLMEGRRGIVEDIHMKDESVVVRQEFGAVIVRLASVIRPFIYLTCYFLAHISSAHIVARQNQPQLQSSGQAPSHTEACSSQKKRGGQQGP